MRNFKQNIYQADTYNTDTQTQQKKKQTFIQTPKRSD